jgi:hypothetical protein
MNRPAPLIAGFAAALALLCVAYLGSYYALLKGMITPSGGGAPVVYSEPVYRSEASFVRAGLEPAHRLDRWIRPGYWGDP